MRPKYPLMTTVATQISYHYNNYTVCASKGVQCERYPQIVGQLVRVAYAGQYTL